MDDVHIRGKPTLTTSSLKSSLKEPERDFLFADTQTVVSNAMQLMDEWGSVE